MRRLLILLFLVAVGTNGCFWAVRVPEPGEGRRKEHRGHDESERHEGDHGHDNDHGRGHDQDRGEHDHH